jgi:hypothetical protein
MVDRLRAMNDEERAAYILMERIIPPSQEADLIRAGENNHVSESFSIKNQPKICFFQFLIRH